VDWEYLAECGLISPDDLEIITFCDTAEEAWTMITDFYA
jgi:predicted Rossmann-fold nucleotide-binding protein